MKIFKMCFLFFLLLSSIYGQKGLTREQLTEDYEVFKEIVTRGHPSLYEYTSVTEWDGLFRSFEQKGIADVKNANDLFKAIAYLANHVNDGHLTVLHPKMETLPDLFPLLLKIIDGKPYTDTNEYGLPIGSEIISINDRPFQQTLDDLLKYAPSDGFNLTKKYRQIEKEFGILHFYEYGYQEHYFVTFEPPNGEVKTIEIAATPFESIGNRYPSRNSHFASYHQKENGVGYFKQTIAEKWPFVTFIDSLNTAVLTVNSFGLDPREFKSKLIGSFKDIERKKSENLVIDIRQNSGGYRINAINLFAFLTNKPFKQRVSESAVTKELPQEKYVVHTLSDFSGFFKMYFASAKKEGKRWIITKDHAQAEMVPFKRPFKGKVYVLIGGNTFSAASAFALNAKNDQNITLVGEETGGGYYFHTGQYSALYELPHSKILLRMPFVKIDKYVLDKTIPKGSGVLPDMSIPLTVKDLIAGVDSQLDYILKQIGKK